MFRSGLLVLIVALAAVLLGAGGYLVASGTAASPALTGCCQGGGCPVCDCTSCDDCVCCSFGTDSAACAVCCGGASAAGAAPSCCRH